MTDSLAEEIGCLIGLVIMLYFLLQQLAKTEENSSKDKKKNHFPDYIQPNFSHDIEKTDIKGDYYKAYLIIDLSEEILEDLFYKIKKFPTNAELLWEALCLSVEKYSLNVDGIKIKSNEFTFYNHIKPWNFKELSDFSHSINYLEILVSTLESFEELEVKSGKNISLVSSSFGNNNVIIKKKFNTNSRCHIFTVKINEIILLPNVFKIIWGKLKYLCIPSCKVDYLQDRVSFRCDYDWWINFECRICGKKYFCECFRPALEGYCDSVVKKHCDEKMNPYLGAGALIEGFVSEYKNSEFKSSCCHMCRGIKPLSCLGKNLIERYYPYVIKEAYNLDKNFFVLKEDFYNGGFLNPEHRFNQIYNEASNKVRDTIGYPRIGERYKRETELYYLIKGLFDGYKIIREASPSWLKPQRLDIFIPDLDLACEYQGEQHYMPISAWGGEDCLEKNKERDRIKKEKCKKNKIQVVYFYYWENINEQLIEKRLKKFIKK